MTLEPGRGGVTYGELTPKTSLVFVLRKFRDDTSLEEDKTIVLPPSKRKLDHYSLCDCEKLIRGLAHTLVTPTTSEVLHPPSPQNPSAAMQKLGIYLKYENVVEKMRPLPEQLLTPLNGKLWPPCSR